MIAPGAAAKISLLRQLEGSDSQRFFFWFVFILSGGLFWLSPHPPMVDIPQHAGQVALFLDLLSNNPHWRDTFYINYFTPYLLGYGLWALLATAMPIAIALKLLLSIAFYAFVMSGMHLRRCCQADDRLDWLLIPSFFGFCFNWGFLTFLMAAPLGILFITQAMSLDKKINHRNLIYLFFYLKLFFQLTF